MPMFDFTCAACGTRFEELVRGDAVPACPQCGADRPRRNLTAPSPLKKRAFPFKPGPVRPMPGMGCGPSCGAGACPAGHGCGEARCPSA